ncbi:MAG: hypothetical protein WDN24_02010 [Sphingomonas sp.]
MADELFPYAASICGPLLKRIPRNPRQSWPRSPGDDPAETLLRWIEEDRKETPLKTLQGLIWGAGLCRRRAERPMSIPTRPEALARWKAMGIPVCIYSSGSIAAQKLIFGHSIAGDLTPLLSGYFDTTTGPKARIRLVPAHRAGAEAHARRDAVRHRTSGPRPMPRAPSACRRC